MRRGRSARSDPLTMFGPTKKIRRSIASPGEPALPGGGAKRGMAKRGMAKLGMGRSGGLARLGESERSRKCKTLPRRPCVKRRAENPRVLFAATALSCQIGRPFAAGWDGRRWE
jgi:hypothetical protein